MADYKVQLKDKDGNRQYPVTTTMLVVDSDGKTVEQRLQKLELGGGGSGSGGSGNYLEVRELKMNEDMTVTEEHKAYNIETYNKALAGETFALSIPNGPILTLGVFGSNYVVFNSFIANPDSNRGSFSLCITLFADGTFNPSYLTYRFGVDDFMSDLSENAVQNKVVKKYIDDAVANAGGGSGDGSQFALRELKLGDGEGNYTEEELAYNQETLALLMAGKYVRFNGNGLAGLSQFTSEDGYVGFTNTIEASITPGVPILVTSIIFNEDGTIDAMEFMAGGWISDDFSEAYISNLIFEYNICPTPTNIYTDHQVSGPYWPDGSVLTQSTYIRGDLVTEEEAYFCYGFKNGPVTFELMINISSGEYKYAITEGFIFITTDSYFNRLNLEIRNYKQILASKFTVLYNSHTCSILFTIGQYGFAFLDPSTGDILRYEIQEDGSVTEITQ